MLAGVALLAILAVSALAYGGRDADAVARGPGAARPTPRPATGTSSAGTCAAGTPARSAAATYVYADGMKAPNPAETDPDVPFSVPSPPEGRYAAVTDMTAPGARLPIATSSSTAGAACVLAVLHDAGPLASPDTLSFDGCEPNQQPRVELMDASAPVTSTAPKHVLAKVFQTQPDDPSTIAPRTVSFDLSEWAGERVRIRFAQVDNSGPLRAGIDDVRLARVGS